MVARTVTGMGIAQHFDCWKRNLGLLRTGVNTDNLMGILFSHYKPITSRIKKKNQPHHDSKKSTSNSRSLLRKAHWAKEIRQYFVEQKSRVRRAFSCFLGIYRYQSALMPVRTLPQRVRVFARAFSRLFLHRKTVLFYPDCPQSIFVIYKIFVALGFHMTTNPSEHCDIAIKWRNTIDRGSSGNPYFPTEAILEDLAQKRSDLTILNMNCNDVSKKRVSRVFEQVFGYSVSVDPGTYSGKCVMKSNWNGLHVGEVIECPTKVRRKGFVYEKLLDNEVGDGLVEDLRVPIFRRTLSFVYRKYRPIEERLVDRSHTLSKTLMANVADLFTEEEIEKINQFCEIIGLDYGEIDIIRDKGDQKIYIVDVNNDPAGPPSPISGHHPSTAVVRLAQAFETTFLVSVPVASAMVTKKNRNHQVPTLTATRRAIVG